MIKHPGLVAGAGFGLFVFPGPALFERLAPPRWVRTSQRLTMPLYRRFCGFAPGWAVIETTGRHSGTPRQTPVGAQLRQNALWIVVCDRARSQYVKNIAADPRVRVQVHGRWHTGVAHLLEHDNPRRRLLRMNPVNSLHIGIAGPDLATMRVDLDAAGHRPESHAEQWGVRSALIPGGVRARRQARH
ncbi:nitroreductase/quinone reductase family protein [Mycolicibacterium boenickei]